jgi:DNA primase large subunit
MRSKEARPSVFLFCFFTDYWEQQVKDENIWNASELDTILHPNEYFKRSFLLKNLSLARSGDLGVDGPSQGSN